MKNTKDIKSRTEAGEKYTNLVLETFRLHGAFITVGDDLVQDWNLTSARWKVLGAINNGANTVPDVARMMGVSRQNVQTIANQLEKDGYVATHHNPAHKKAKLYILTDYGNSVMKGIEKKQIDWANKIAKHFDKEELDTTIAIMKKIKTLILKEKEENKEHSNS